MKSRIAICAAVLVTLGAASRSMASTVFTAGPVYGGPTYDTSTMTGYSFGSVPTYGALNLTNGLGVSNERYSSTSGGSAHTPAVRWDSGGGPVTELKNLGADPYSGAYNTDAYGVGPTGVIVGSADEYVGGASKGTVAVKWNSAGTTATPLSVIGVTSVYLGQTANYARAINTAGTIVGSYIKYSSAGVYLGVRAVRWDSNGNATDLGALPGTSYYGTTTAYALAINTAGTIAGTSEKYSGTGSSSVDLGQSIVRWDAGSTTPTELITNVGTGGTGNPYATLIGINDAGTIVGNQASGYYSDQALEWAPGTTVATLLQSASPDAEDTSSTVLAINNHGTAIGTSSKTVNGTQLGTRAVRWDPGVAAPTELGNLAASPTGVAYADARAINSAGTIVGDGYLYTGENRGDEHAVLWGSDGVAVDLNSLLSTSDAAHWLLIQASTISDSNWITGVAEYTPDGDFTDEYQRAFLIQVPEPTDFAVASLLALPLCRRRRGWGKGHHSLL